MPYIELPNKEWLRVPKGLSDAAALDYARNRAWFLYKELNRGIGERAVSAAVEGVGQIPETGRGISAGIQSLFGGREGVQKYIDEQKKEQEESGKKPRAITFQNLIDQYKSEGVLPALSNVPAYLTEQVLQQGPSMAVPFAAAGAATAYSAPFVGLAAPLVGAAAGLGTYGLQTFAENIQKQALTPGRTAETMEPGKALGAAAIGAPLGFFVDRWALGLGKVSTKAAAVLMEKELAARGVGKTLAVGAARGLLEVPTELIETALGRAQAGLSLTDKDAKAEFLETLGSSLAIGPTAGAGFAYRRRGQARAAGEEASQATAMQDRNQARMDALKQEQEQKLSPEYRDTLLQERAPLMQRMEELQAIKKAAGKKGKELDSNEYAALQDEIKTVGQSLAANTRALKEITAPIPLEQGKKSMAQIQEELRVKAEAEQQAAQKKAVDKAEAERRKAEAERLKAPPQADMFGSIISGKYSELPSESMERITGLRAPEAAVEETPNLPEEYRKAKAESDRLADTMEAASAKKDWAGYEAARKQRIPFEEAIKALETEATKQQVSLVPQPPISAPTVEDVNKKIQKLADQGKSVAHLLPQLEAAKTSPVQQGIQGLYPADIAAHQEAIAKAKAAAEKEAKERGLITDDYGNVVSGKEAQQLVLNISAAEREYQRTVGLRRDKSKVQQDIDTGYITPEVQEYLGINLPERKEEAGEKATKAAAKLQKAQGIQPKPAFAGYNLNQFDQAQQALPAINEYIALLSTESRNIAQQGEHVVNGKITASGKQLLTLEVKIKELQRLQSIAQGARFEEEQVNIPAMQRRISELQNSRKPVLEKALVAPKEGKPSAVFGEVGQDLESRTDALLEALQKQGGIGVISENINDVFDAVERLRMGETQTAGEEGQRAVLGTRTALLKFARDGSTAIENNAVEEANLRRKLTRGADLSTTEENRLRGEVKRVFGRLLSSTTGPLEKNRQMSQRLTVMLEKVKDPIARKILLDAKSLFDQNKTARDKKANVLSLINATENILKGGATPRNIVVLREAVYATASYTVKQTDYGSILANLDARIATLRKAGVPSASPALQTLLREYTSVFAKQKENTLTAGRGLAGSERSQIIKGVDSAVTKAATVPRGAISKGPFGLAKSSGEKVAEIKEAEKRGAQEATLGTSGELALLQDKIKSLIALGAKRSEVGSLTDLFASKFKVRKKGETQRQAQLTKEEINQKLAELSALEGKLLDRVGAGELPRFRKYLIGKIDEALKRSGLDEKTRDILQEAKDWFESGRGARGVKETKTGEVLLGVNPVYAKRDTYKKEFATKVDAEEGTLGTKGYTSIESTFLPRTQQVAYETITRGTLESVNDLLNDLSLGREGNIGSVKEALNLEKGVIQENSEQQDLFVAPGREEKAKGVAGQPSIFTAIKRSTAENFREFQDSLKKRIAQYNATLADSTDAAIQTKLKKQLGKEGLEGLKKKIDTLQKEMLIPIAEQLERRIKFLVTKNASAALAKVKKGSEKSLGEMARLQAQIRSEIEALKQTRFDFLEGSVFEDSKLFQEAFSKNLAKALEPLAEQDLVTIGANTLAQLNKLQGTFSEALEKVEALKAYSKQSFVIGEATAFNKATLNAATRSLESALTQLSIQNATLTEAQRREKISVLATERETKLQQMQAQLRTEGITRAVTGRSLEQQLENLKTEAAALSEKFRNEPDVAQRLILKAELNSLANERRRVKTEFDQSQKSARTTIVSDAIDNSQQLRSISETAAALRQNIKNEPDAEKRTVLETELNKLAEKRQSLIDKTNVPSVADEALANATRNLSTHLTILSKSFRTLTSAINFISRGGSAGYKQALQETRLSFGETNVNEESNMFKDFLLANLNKKQKIVVVPSVKNINALIATRLYFDKSGVSEQSSQFIEALAKKRKEIQKEINAKKAEVGDKVYAEIFGRVKAQAKYGFLSGVKAKVSSDAFKATLLEGLKQIRVLRLSASDKQLLRKLRFKRTKVGTALAKIMERADRAQITIEKGTRYTFEDLDTAFADIESQLKAPETTPEQEKRLTQDRKELQQLINAIPAGLAASKRGGKGATFVSYPLPKEKKTPAEKRADKITKRVENRALQTAKKESPTTGTAGTLEEDLVDTDVSGYGQEKPPLSESRGSAVNSSDKDTVYKELSRAFKGKNVSDRVTIYDTVAEARKAHPDHANEMHKDTRGFTIKGEVFLVAENIEKGKALSVLLHELGVHVGFRNFFNPKEFKALVNVVKQWAGRKDNSLEAKVGRAAMARVEAAQTNEAQFDDELLAYAVEEAVALGLDPAGLKGGSPIRNWFNRLVKAFRSALEKLGLAPETLTAQNLVDFAYGTANIEMGRGGYHGTGKSFTAFDLRKAGTGEGSVTDAYKADRIGAGPYVGIGGKDRYGRVDSRLGRRTAEHYQYNVPFMQELGKFKWGNTTYTELQKAIEDTGGTPFSKLKLNERAAYYKQALLGAYAEDVFSGGEVNPSRNKGVLEELERIKERDATLKLPEITLDPANIKPFTGTFPVAKLYATLDDIPDKQIYDLNSYIKPGENLKEDALVEAYGSAEDRRMFKYDAKKVAAGEKSYGVGFPRNALFFDLVKVHGPDDAALRLKEAGYRAIQRNTDMGRMRERAYIEEAPEILAEMADTAMGEAEEILFSRSKAKMPPGFEAVQDFAEAAIAKKQGLLATIKSRSKKQNALAFKVAEIDRLAAIEEMADQAIKAGNSNEAMQMMYFLQKQLDMLSMASASAYTGALDLIKENGEFRIQAKEGASLRTTDQALKPLIKMGFNAEGAENLFTAYIASLRGEQEGYNKLNFSPEVIKMAQEVVPNIEIEANQKVKDVLDLARAEYNEYNKGQLRFLEKTGAITPELAADLLKKKDFIPYYRDVGGQLSLFIGSGTPIKLGELKNQPHLQKLVGGDEKIMSYFESSMQNTLILTDLSLRNLATKNTAHAFHTFGVLETTKGRDGKEHAIRLGDGPANANVLHFRDKGVEKHVVVKTEGTAYEHIPTELLVKGMEGTAIVMPKAIEILSIPAQVLRKGITLAPLYPYYQLVKDSMAMGVTRGVSFSNTASIIKAVKQYINGGDLIKELQSKGVIFQAEMLTGTMSDVAKIRNRVVEGEGKLHKFIAGQEARAIKADGAVRAVLYSHYIKEGLSPRDAEYMTIKAMPYSRRGLDPTLRYLSQMTPFFNAQIVGLYSLYQSLRGQGPMSGKLQIKKKLYTAGMSMAVGTLIYSALVSGEDWYENMPLETRLRNWIIKLPGVQEPIAIPIPFEFGIIFKSVFEAIYMGAFRDSPEGAKVRDALRKVILGSIPGGTIPLEAVPVIKAVPMPIPTIAQPLISLGFNRDAFSNNPIEGERELGVNPAERFRDTTSEAAKRLGRLADVSPMQIDYLIRGYTGTVGPAVIALVDALTGPANAAAGVKQELPASKLPFLNQIFKPADGGALIDLAVDSLKQAAQTRKTYEKIANEGRYEEAEAYLDKNLADIKRGQLAGKLRQRLGLYSKAERDIKASDSTPLEKRRALEDLKQFKIQESKEFMQEFRAGA